MKFRHTPCRILLFVLFLLVPCSLAQAVESPRNIILMIGDGMGFEHLKTAGYVDNQGRMTPPFTCFPVQLQMKTGSLGDRNDSPAPGSVTDSAASATALSTGHKTFNGVLGMAPDRGGRLHPVINLMEAAEQTGRSTGVVTTVPFSHATPAAFAAHVADREDYGSIARQMLTTSGLDVIAGAGHPYFDDNGHRLRLRVSYRYVGGRNLWGELDGGRLGNDADGDGIFDPWTLVDSTETIRSLADGLTPKRLLLLAPAASTLQQKRSGPAWVPADAVSFSRDMPTLADLSLAAINRLDDDQDGFVLMIEGGAIDWAGHANQTGRMIEELDDFARTVALVERLITDRLGWDRTLLLITADHETGGLSDGTWTSHKHTGTPVPLLARGKGAESLPALADAATGLVDNAALGRWLLQRVMERPSNEESRHE
ncbi:MAG: alkaline phosphatase [Geothermobacteraceae bacterium]